MPGTVRNGVINDELTGAHIEIRAGACFTRITVNGRDYYFRRFSGQYDGSGMGCG
jgi:hypothetical protein